MTENDVSILLEILDLEYLKPILIDRFQTVQQLANVDLHSIGINDESHIIKLRYALDEITQNKKSIEQVEPILSIDESNKIIERLENEADLVSSCLNLLLDNNINSNGLPYDDATSDIEYCLYNQDIDQIEHDLEQLKIDTDDLIKHIETQFPQVQHTPSQTKHEQKSLFKLTAITLTISVFCIGLLLYIKRK